MLAGHGFVVAVPEVFHEFEQPGTVLPYDQAGADGGNADKIAKELSSYDDDARAALNYLRAHPKCTGKLGVMGFCIGGHLAFRAAMNTDVLAATCCYPTDIHKRSLGKGLDDNSLDRIPEISGELLIVFGRQDPHIPREGRAIIYNALADAIEFSAGTSSMELTHSCETKGRDTTLPRRAPCMEWQSSCSNVNLGRATSPRLPRPTPTCRISALF